MEKEYTLKRDYNEQERLFIASDINEELETEEIKRAENEEAALINDIFSGSIAATILAHQTRPLLQ